MYTFKIVSMFDMKWSQEETKRDEALVNTDAHNSC